MGSTIPSSTLRVSHNVYSVDSRLIGETVEIHLHADHLEIYYGQRHLETIPRLRGESGALIQYRHIIDWLVGKPGAFENYRYRAALFPSSRFRMAYDALRQHHRREQADKDYLRILHLSAQESETRVDQALHHLLDSEQPLTVEAVKTLVLSADAPPSYQEVSIPPVDLTSYDVLLEESR